MRAPALRCLFQLFTGTGFMCARVSWCVGFCVNGKLDVIRERLSNLPTHYLIDSYNTTHTLSSTLFKTLDFKQKNSRYILIFGGRGWRKDLISRMIRSVKGSDSWMELISERIRSTKGFDHGSDQWKDLISGRT